MKSLSRVFLIALVCLGIAAGGLFVIYTRAVPWIRDKSPYPFDYQKAKIHSWRSVHFEESRLLTPWAEITAEEATARLEFKRSFPWWKLTLDALQIELLFKKRNLPPFKFSHGALVLVKTREALRVTFSHWVSPGLVFNGHLLTRSSDDFDSFEAEGYIHGDQLRTFVPPSLSEHLPAESRPFLIRFYPSGMELDFDERPLLRSQWTFRNPQKSAPE